jgi:hypothetical protein
MLWLRVPALGGRKVMMKWNAAELDWDNLCDTCCRPLVDGVSFCYEVRGMHLRLCIICAFSHELNLAIERNKKLAVDKIKLKKRR